MRPNKKTKLHALQISQFEPSNTGIEYLKFIAKHAKGNNYQ
jgi:hypothetical protein